MIQINDKCFYDEIDNCLISYNSVSLIEALNLLFNLQIDSNKSIINNNFTRLVIASEDKESSRELFAKGFIETLTLLKEQFKIPVVVEDSYNKTSDNWTIKLDNKYKEAYDDYLKLIMIGYKPIITKPKRTRRKKFGK
jgi:K+-sensing histidine kinase KdpD